MAIAASGYARSRIGTKGDEAHAARESKHNPEHPPPPGNPDYQVDAVDIDHAPELGVDVGRIWEAIRLSRDPRVYLAIFNHRQFSSYARDGYGPYEWRPYTGDDPHTGHGHLEVDDVHHDDTRPWSIGMTDLTPERLKYIDDLNSYLQPRVEGLARGDSTIRFGGDVGKPNWLVGAIKGLATDLASLRSLVTGLASMVAKIPTTVPTPAPYVMTEQDKRDIAAYVVAELRTIQFTAPSTNQ